MSQLLHDWGARAGDPTLVGWIIALSYFAAALLAGRAAGLARRSGREDERRFWLFLCAVLVFLGLNKQLDLQTLLTQTGRDLARSEGWYRQRRAYQALFQIVLTAVSLGALIITLRRFRGSHGAVKLAIFGLICTILYVLTRAASFHHTDMLLRLTLGAMRLGWIVELAGIAIMALAALIYSAPKRASG